jgi:hypothetical protein
MDTEFPMSLYISLMDKEEVSSGIVSSVEQMYENVTNILKMAIRTLKLKFS